MEVSQEERQAWDQAATASLSRYGDLERPELAAELAGKVADAMLVERRKRFGAGVAR